MIGYLEEGCGGFKGNTCDHLKLTAMIQQIYRYGVKYNKEHCKVRGVYNERRTKERLSF